jgi:hypothetical protein
MPRNALAAQARPAPLTFVTWKWKPKPGYRSTFTGAHVNTMARMIGRNYQHPHRVICITDDATGIDASIGIVPLWSDHANLPSPHGPRNPSCYVRLKMFSREAADFIGPRFLSIDLDTVITGDLAPIVHRQEEIVLFADTNPTTYYNGGLILMTAGSRAKVWDTFDPVKSPIESRRQRQWGSDQGHISACLGPNEAKWGPKDGVYSYRCHVTPQRGRLPDNAALVSFHGAHDPWGPEAQRLDWVRNHYR